MKKVIVLLFASILAMYGCKPEPKSVVNNGIRWTGENETANYLALTSLIHLINIEYDKAYTLSEHAVELDSSLFASHVMLAMLSGKGEKKELHKAMAKKYSQNENETGKLFVSLLDVEDTTRQAQRDIWAKMHQLSNGPFIHLMFARSRSIKNDTATVLGILDSLIQFDESNKLSTSAAAAYNIKGYVLQSTGNMDGAVAAIEKSATLYPTGYNPIDSRAEMYLLAKDTANAIVWYKKVLERYPFAANAADRLKLLEPKKK